MTAPMTDAEIREALARAERARRHVNGLCIGTMKWRMRVPPQADDSDLVICNALDDSKRLAADLLAARAERDEARAAHESERRVYGEDVRINAARAETAETELAELRHWKDTHSVGSTLRTRAETAEARCRELEAERAIVADYLRDTDADFRARRPSDRAVLNALLSPPSPHTCQIHRATSGASDCGLEPCEEAKVHRDRGEARTATVRRAVPAVAEKHGQYCPKNPDATIRHMVDFCTCGPTPAESATHEDEMERMCRENREAMAARYGPNWDCKTCGGSGRVVRDNGINPVHGEPVEIEEPCPDCHGCGGAK